MAWIDAGRLAMNEHAANTDPGHGDIFVGGAMRSGTTLLQRVLCTSPAVNDFVPEAHLLRELVALYKSCREAGDTVLQPFFSDRESCHRYFSAGVLALLAIARERHNPGGPLVLKNPELTMWFPELSTLLPNARFAMIVRDPRDCIASMKVVAERARKAGSPPPMPEMARGMEGFAALYLKYYAPLMNSALFGDRLRFFSLRYEDLVSGADTCVAALELWSGLDIDAAAIGDSAAGDDGSVFGSALYGRRISAGSVGNYRNRLSADEIAVIEKVAGDFIEFFGYPLHAEPATGAAGPGG